MTLVAQGLRYGMICDDAGRKVQIKKIFGTAWDKFKSLGFIPVDQFRKLEIDKDVLESCVLCGAQARSLTEVVTNRIQTCQRKMERSMLCGTSEVRILSYG